MFIVHHIFLALGGITLFLLGLKYMSDSMQQIAGNKIKNIMSNLTENRLTGVLTGTITTAILQSSSATNIILVGFASTGIISFFSASSVVMGANIGTTITAQLVSLSGKEFFDITAFGSLIAFIGFIFGFTKSKNLRIVGEIMIGFGMIFLGLDIITDAVLFFKNFESFRKLFLVENDFVLLLNGLIITSIIQSSSAVTAIMIILGGNGLLTFESSMFLILGANVGACFPVIIASLNKNENARQVAFFNILFNIFGAIILFLPIHFLKTYVASWFKFFSGDIERMIANFHTIFNLVVTIILLPILKPFTNFVSLIVTDKKKINSTKSVKLKPKQA